MKVLPYYSLQRGMAVEELWHDNDECEIGRSIALLERLPLLSKDKGYFRKHCPYCQLLNKPRRAITRW